ncbi:aminotransferase class IV family protein [Paracoccus sp. C2R09]|nr:aminotransferase class IV family protein [Paracoccus sp. C2R09]
MQVRISGPVPDGLTIFETLRMEPDGSVRLWPLHVARLQSGCAAVGFPLDEAKLDLSHLPRGKALRVRMAVDMGGGVQFSHAELPPNPPFWMVALSGRVESDDPWLRIKSSRRAVYDRARAGLPDGVDEAILTNERGEICEGSITNLFLQMGGRLLTPPLSSGLLPGVLRQSLLQAGDVEEAVLRPDELRRGEIWMGNALRGLIPARLIP